MACPMCGCKEHYQSDIDDDDIDLGYGDDTQRCAACGFFFDIADAAEDDEDDA